VDHDYEPLPSFDFVDDDEEEISDDEVLNVAYEASLVFGWRFGS